MALKTFYKNFVKQQLVEKMLFSKNVYSKYLVRNSLLFDDNIFCTDFLGLDRKNKGFSIRLNKQIFRHKKYSKIRFFSFLNYSKFRNDFLFSSKLYSSLHVICQIRKLSCLMLILNPKKGGFKVYSNGVLAFLPTNQKIYCLKKFYQYSSVNNVLKFSLFFCRKHISKSFFYFFVPLSNIKMVIYSNYQNYNFSNYTKLQYRKLIKSRFNFLFLIQEKKLKLNKR